MQKKVLITGISRGLGKELFNLFAAKNYFVYGIGRNESTVEVFQQKYPENSKIILADLSSDQAIEQIQAIVQNQSIDLLINNAGIAGQAHLLQQVESSEINDLLNIHCLGVFRTTKALARNLLAAEQPIILNLNSRFGSTTRQANRTYENLTISYSYRIAKAAQNMLTNCLRVEFKDRIKVISIHPGKMKTEIATSDANLDPSEVANRIEYFYEHGLLKEENGIIELEKELIEW